jgi:hypothetical protein
VVVLRVPASTTFPQGVVLCDVTAASTSILACTSRGHLATSATAQDPLALAVQPQPTDARFAAAPGMRRARCTAPTSAALD